MKTQDSINHNEYGTSTLHVYDKSAPSISPEVFADTTFRLIRSQHMTQEAIAILQRMSETGNLKACFSLLNNKYFEDMSNAQCSSVTHPVCIAALKNSDPYAQYIAGRSLLSIGMKSEGHRFLNMAFEKGINESYWYLALRAAQNDDPRAIKYCSKAAAAGYSPAVDALSLVDSVRENLRHEIEREYRNSFRSLCEEKRILNRRNEALQNTLQARLIESDNQISLLLKRCEEAESTLASRTVQAMHNIAIAKQQIEISRLEAELLEAQCGQEEAFAEKAKAEKVANDLTRRNKHLAGLLRKNRIAFNEYESSSSSEEQP